MYKGRENPTEKTTVTLGREQTNRSEQHVCPLSHLSDLQGYAERVFVIDTQHLCQIHSTFIESFTRQNLPLYCHIPFEVLLQKFDE